MISRVIFITISALFSAYCVFVALITFFGKDDATYHLQKIYVVGFSAAYAILTPFGIAGVIGGLNRKKSLIRGFMFQYWFATFVFIGLSVGLLVMARRLRRDTFSKCIGEFPATSDPDTITANKQTCVDKVFSLENTIKIAAFAQGGALVFFGILVLIFGIREFKDIKMDEETSNLIEKASFDDKNEIQSDISSITSGHNLLLPPERSLNRNPSSASSAYSQSSSNSSGSMNRYPPIGTFSPHGETLSRVASPSPFPPPSNYRHPNVTNLSRHPTNASNYTTITTASSLSSASSNYSNRYNPNVNRNYPTGGGGISRYPTNASNYSSISSNSNRSNRSNRSNYSNYSNHSNHSTPRGNYNGTPPPPIPPIPNHYSHNLPPQSSLQRPFQQQYSSIPDNNRFIANKSPPLSNNNNIIPPLTVNDKPILEEEESYDDYNNYN